MTRSWKYAYGAWKVLEFFLTKRVGTLAVTAVNFGFKIQIQFAYIRYLNLGLLSYYCYKWRRVTYCF